MQSQSVRHEWHIACIIHASSSTVTNPLACPAPGFAVVKLATDRQTHQHYAVKIMALPEMGFEPGDNENTREDIFKEIDILCGLCHDNVVYLKEYFEEGNKVRRCGQYHQLVASCS